VDERFLITGSEGCIGAWVLRQLVAEGVPCIAFDLVAEGRRLRQIAGDEVAESITYAQGDLTLDGDIERVMAEHAPTHIVHLAGLQVPFVAADPVLGALVNVAGTVRVFEAARHSGATVRGLSYASSAAVYDPTGELRPRTLYGVYKRCNEETARHYAESLDVASVGLRPWTVFGVGRDQGVTSAPTSAIQAVVRGETYEIPFTGSMAMQYTADVAAAFIAAARAHPTESASYDLPGAVMSVDEVIAGIESAVPGATGRITSTGAELPIAALTPGPSLLELVPDLTVTPFADAVAQTAARFAELDSAA
jgi:nucleoside-diphosphate-sugar epimerase